MSFLGITGQAANAPNFQNLTGVQPTNLLSGYGASGAGIDPTLRNLLGGIGGLSQYNLGGLNLGMGQNIGMGAVGDPNAGSYLGGAFTAAGLGESAALNQFGAGSSIYGTAFDPQSALYQRLYGQTTDAARANASAAGLGTTPAGALATSLAQNNFNIDWQNAQLQRQIAGAGAASGLQGGAAPLFLQSAGMPYATSQGIYGNQLGTLGRLGSLGIQASQIPGQQISGWQQGLGLMGGLQQQAFNQQQTRWQDYFQQYQQQQAQALAAQQAQASQLAGLGKFAGTALGGIGGFMLGGPMGAMAGASLGGGLFGGSPSGAGGNPFGGSPYANAPANWYQPFGGLFSNPGTFPSAGAIY